MNTEAITHKSGQISQESRDMAKLASKTKKKNHQRHRALQFTLIYCFYIILFNLPFLVLLNI